MKGKLWDECPLEQLEDCSNCGFRLDIKCNWSGSAVSRKTQIRREREREESLAPFRSLKSLMIVDIAEYQHDYDTADLFALILSDGRILIAEDSEYGDNSFQFITVKELEELSNVESKEGE